MNIKPLVIAGTFVGATAVCAVLSATYPIAIWAVAYGIVQRKPFAKEIAKFQIDYSQWKYGERQSFVCPLAQKHERSDVS